MEEKVIPISRSQKVFSPQPETSSTSIEDELKTLGINLNPTLRKTIKQADEQQVLDAIEALKEQIKPGKVSNAGGWLNKAIKEGWSKPESVTIPTKPEHKIVTKSTPSDKKLVSTDKLKTLSNLFRNHND